MRRKADSLAGQGKTPLFFEEDGRLLVISRSALEAKPYHESAVNVTWETSTLREWLNGEFYEKSFTDDEKSRFVSTGGDYVTLMTLGEAKTFFNDPGITLAKPTYYAKKHGLSWDFTSGGSSYWLKTADPSKSVYVTWVDFEGLVHENGYTVWTDKVLGVRPVMWVRVD